MAIMIVLNLTDCPNSLRGDLTKWLLEISAGVFVGQLSARVRDELWRRICGAVKRGKVIMVYSAQNEQHLLFKTYHCEWEPIDFDGIKLMLRPSPSRAKRLRATSMPTIGWSNASQYRFAKRRS
jgi:CRISPR-associated protein Cas2